MHPHSLFRLANHPIWSHVSHITDSHVGSRLPWLFSSLYSPASWASKWQWCNQWSVEYTAAHLPWTLHYIGNNLFNVQRHAEYLGENWQHWKCCQFSPKYSTQTPHSLPARVSYGVSFVWVTSLFALLYSIAGLLVRGTTSLPIYAIW